MTAAHPIRRLLARFCSADTMARIVDPTLADMCVERGRPAWLGYLAVARALAAHGILSTPRRARQLWVEDGAAFVTAGWACAATATFWTMCLVAVPGLGHTGPQQIGLVRSVLLLTPQALILALPASLLVAIPLAFQGVRVRSRILKRSLGLAGVCALGTFALLTWAMPEANQAFRVATSGHADIPRGPAELSWGQLREQIDHQPSTEHGIRTARELTYRYQVRLMLTGVALPLGILAGALGASRWGRRRPFLTGTLASLGYLAAIPPLVAAAHFLMSSVTALPSGFFAWLPWMLIAAVAGASWRATGRSTATAGAP
jgi:hypothetical protein